jgi:hypothetical protein
VDAGSDSEGDEEDQEHDEVLMDAATDLMPALASVLGAAYAPLFAEHFGPLFKFAVSGSVAVMRKGGIRGGVAVFYKALRF